MKLQVQFKCSVVVLGGGGSTRMLKPTGMCCPNGLLFHQKSLDMGPIFVKKILRRGPHFTKIVEKIVKLAIF